jgi:tetratricopeptide (TPR) repeat protein
MFRRVLIASLVAATLCRPALCATDQWIDIRSSHFTVLTDANEKEGRHIVDQFERMRWVFQTLFPKVNVDPAVPIVVVAAKNEKTFAAMEPADYLAKGQMKLGGYYLHTQDRNYILLRLDTEFEHPFASVYHEYTHVQFAGAADWMPIWLNEGLAEFMQNSEIRDKEVLLGEPSADDILYLREHALIPFNVLFKVDADSPYYHQEQKASVFYAESWALTHYLMVSDHERHTQRLDDYMALLRQHEDPVSAGEKAFGDLKKFQSELESYIRNADYKQFVMNSAAASIDESSFKVTTLTPADADAVKADVLAYVGRGDDARALLESVLKEDPNSQRAHETMGYLEYHAQHFNEARRWFGEAVAADNEDFLAHFYYATLCMSEPGTCSDHEIENNLHTAIQLNSRFAPAYDRMAAFYAMKRENLDEARRMSIWAVQLDPSIVYYRMNAASVLIAMERYSDAIAVLQAAARVAHSPSDTAMVQRRLDDIERMKAQNAQVQAYARVQADANADTVMNAQPADSGGVDVSPKHPTEPATGTRHIANGVIRQVACSYPSALEFRVQSTTGKTLALFSNDFFKIQLTVVGLKAGDSMNPCTDFEGKNAQVQYVESSDKSVDGQVVAVELRK